MIIIDKHGCLEFFQIKIYPTTQTFHSRSSVSAMFTSLLPLEGFHDFFFKNKIPATSIRQKPFSKFSHVAHMKWPS
jgi:hypothetical protein